IMSNGKEMFRLRLNMTRFHVSLRASTTSVAINRQRISTHRAFKTVDCFASLAMTKAKIAANTHNDAYLESFEILN
ncbi:MAG: hypothetical protein K2N54_07970, partial [Helicobacter sp.]|nr:hypothetical protein [Helicobacter sp.]